MHSLALTEAEEEKFKQSKKGIKAIFKKGLEAKNEDDNPKDSETPKQAG
jgi:hypothetical protein